MTVKFIGVIRLQNEYTSMTKTKKEQVSNDQVLSQSEPESYPQNKKW